MSPQSEQAEALAVQLISGPGADRALAAVTRAAQLCVPGASASALPTGSWRLVQLNHRPGAGVTGCFAVMVDRRPSSLPRHRGLRPGEVMVCLSTAPMPRDAQVTTIQWKGLRFFAWLWPQDPWLPGLHSAAAPTADLVGDGPVRSVPVGYRPTRRAVFRVFSGPPAQVNSRAITTRHHDDDQHLAYIKVVRPSRQAELLHTHNLLTLANVPVPRPLATRGDGAVALSPVAGPTVAQVFCGRDTEIPDPEQLMAVLDRFPPEVMNLSSRPSWADRVLDHARSAIGALPDEQRRVHSLAERVHTACVSPADSDLVPTHGDFHPGNVILGPHPVDPALGPITGVLDLDNVGPGRLSDDLACYLAHLWALAGDSPARSHLTILQRHTRIFDELVEPAELRARTAGVLISLIGVSARRHGAEAAKDRLRRAETLMREYERLS
ncbi:phosphotransferase [Kocuria sp. ZOR0020]|uniref:phosphotransferase n=1 Tax=Kocuria sp. ZOR0020 TaxID=1339234 RepID=UPI0006457E8D|nr:phosphotransferase [Kocuria sp. ZOR0020]